MHSSLAHHSARYGNLRDLVTSEGNGSMYHGATMGIVVEYDGLSVRSYKTKARL